MYIKKARRIETLFMVLVLHGPCPPFTCPLWSLSPIYLFSMVLVPHLLVLYDPCPPMDLLLHSPVPPLYLSFMVFVFHFPFPLSSYLHDYFLAKLCCTPVTFLFN